MKDTLLDDEEPVPDTLSDPPPFAAPETEVDDAPVRPARPAPRGRRRLAVALSALAALALVSAVAVYLFVVRYEPVARRHIPGNANFAARVEFSKILLFGPVRDHLWPLVRGGGEANATGPSRLERIKETTGVDLSRDPRELVVASTDGAAWVLVLGGRFARGRFVQGLDEVARAERWPSFHLEGELLLGPGGLAIGQAEDGSIVVGSSAAVATAALPASDEYKHLELADDGAVTFAATHEAWSGASGLLGSLLDHTPAANRAERATGKLTLGSAPALTVRIEPRLGQHGAALAKDLETTVAELRLVTLLLPDQIGEKDALAGLRIEAAPDGAIVTVTAPWPYQGLDKGCARVAAALRAISGP